MEGAGERGEREEGNKKGRRGEKNGGTKVLFFSVFVQKVEGGIKDIEVDVNRECSSWHALDLKSPDSDQ